MSRCASLKAPLASEQGGTIRVSIYVDIFSAIFSEFTMSDIDDNEPFGEGGGDNLSLALHIDVDNNHSYPLFL